MWVFFIFIESPRDFLTLRDRKAKHPVQTALYSQYLSITNSKYIPYMVFVRSVKNIFIFKQPNSVKYVIITAQMVTESLTENYWVTAWSKSKKECVIYLWKMLCRQPSFYERTSVIFIILDILVHISLIFHKTWILFLVFTLTI